MAGFSSVFANDVDQYACETYRHNHNEAEVYEGSVEDLSADKIFEITGIREIPLLIGGPNCQGVSLRGNRDPHDPKNLAFYNFVRLVNEVQPEWFVMENVPGLLHKHNRELVTSIFQEFHSIGYECGAEILLAADYGVPQLRYRLILIGNRVGQPIIFPDQTHQQPIAAQSSDEDNNTLEPWLTVADAIRDLPDIENGGGEPISKYSRRQPSEFALIARGSSKEVQNHICHKTSEKNIEMIKHIPQGGNWRDIPESIRPPRFKSVALKDHTTTYGRLSWNMPSRTITTYFNNISSGAFTHPTQHRGISVREGARLQGFPDSFVFKGTLARQYRQIGNAVPPLLAQHIATPLKQIINGTYNSQGLIHEASVLYDSKSKSLKFNRPLQGMRFNLDKHLVKGARSAISKARRTFERT
jgi:DNA (cytosine-5)-methyltransferase 1